MFSVDTNILFPAVTKSSPYHQEARDFFESLESNEDVALSEFILLELYGRLRHPAVLNKPLTPSSAVSVRQTFRSHGYWQILGLPQDSRDFHNDFWPLLTSPQCPRRRSYDLRTGLSLVRQGVTEFAMFNVKDFEGLGFQRVWNPLQ